jgi:serine/threonine-protein phosphatase 6 regulatory ankyrin repeat subunit B
MNNTTCSICREDLYTQSQHFELNIEKHPKVAITKCKHSLHLECIKTCLDYQEPQPIEDRTCANCRQVATPLSLVFDVYDIEDNFSNYCCGYVEEYPLSACNTSSIDYFKKLLQNYPEYIQKTFKSKEFGNDISLLMYAVLKEYLEITKLLISKDVNVNQIHPKYKTPLFQAVQQKDKTIAEELVDAGATFKATDTYADEMVETALKKNRQFIINGLIVGPDDANFIDDCIFYAINNHCYNAMDTLINKANDFNLILKDKTALLNLAITSSFPLVVLLLAKNMPNLDTINTNEDTGMILAVKHRLLPMVKILIDFTANTIILKKALSLAITLGDQDIFMVLFEKFKKILGSNLNSFLGRLLYEAVCNGRTTLVKILCDECRGDDANYINLIFNWQLLSTATDIGNPEILEMLCSKNGVDLNKTNNNNETPLFSAAYSYRSESVEILLKYGADPNIGALFDARLINPIDMACDRGDLDTVKTLVNYKAEFDTPRENSLSPMGTAAQRGFYQIVEFLLQQGAKPDTPHVDGETALIQASQYGHTNVVKLLLDASADHSIQQEKGHTALHIASKYNKLEVVKLLLEKGADSSIKNGNGYTAFDIANAKNHREIANLLEPKRYAMETFV